MVIVVIKAINYPIANEKGVLPFTAGARIIEKADEKQTTNHFGGNKIQSATWRETQSTLQV